MPCSVFCMSGEPYLGWDENRVVFSSSCGCSLVGAWLTGCVMVRGMAGRMVATVCSCCQLLPLLMFELPILLVRISLFPSLVMTVSGVTDGNSNQDGFLPHQKIGTEGKCEAIGGFCY